MKMIRKEIADDMIYRLVKENQKKRYSEQDKESVEESVSSDTSKEQKQDLEK